MSTTMQSYYFCKKHSNAFYVSCFRAFWSAGQKGENTETTQTLAFCNYLFLTFALSLRHMKKTKTVRVFAWLERKCAKMLSVLVFSTFHIFVTPVRDFIETLQSHRLCFVWGEKTIHEICCVSPLLRLRKEELNST